MDSKILRDLRADLHLSQHRLMNWTVHIAKEVEKIDDMMAKIDLLILNEGEKNG